MIFITIDDPLRDNKSFRDYADQKHYKGNSPFENIRMDLIKQFPLDYMHVVLLGILKLLLKLWIKLYPGLRSEQFDRLSEVFISMTQFVPKEISRKPQPLYELKRWKATTLRLFLLYFCPVILSDVLTSDYVKHFNCLSFAIRILCDPDDYFHNNETADLQSRYFVKEFETLYPEYSVPNVHALIH